MLELYEEGLLPSSKSSVSQIKENVIEESTSLQVTMTSDQE